MLSKHHLLPLLLALATLPGLAQASLPDAPPSAALNPTGTLQGTVTDPAGDSILGAQVHLTSDALPAPLDTITDSEGCYHFIALPPGRYTVAASSQGFSTAQLSAAVAPGEMQELPDLPLPVAGARADIQVTMTLHDEAEAEIKDEEHQRLGGVVPNFYVTYNWHAAPLSTGQKYKLLWRTLYDPVNLGINAGVAGIEKGAGAFSGYGTGVQSYFKILGATNADFLIGASLGGAVFPQIFHQDPRYFYKGFGTVRSRLLYAIATAVICRGDNGKWQPNYSSVLGDFASGAASNLYYPASNRTGAALVFENGLIQTAEQAIGDVIQEFAFRHATPNAPTYAPTPAKPHN